MIINVCREIKDEKVSFFWMPIPVSDRRKVCVQYSHYIPSVGCSVVVEERGDVAVETGASSDTMAPPQSDTLATTN